MKWYCRLVVKNIFWTYKFAVGIIDMGNSESQDQYAQIVNESLSLYKSHTN